MWGVHFGRHFAFSPFLGLCLFGGPGPLVCARYCRRRVCFLFTGGWRQFVFLLALIGVFPARWLASGGLLAPWLWGLVSREPLCLWGLVVDVLLSSAA